MAATESSPLLQALEGHHVRASVVDLDHYRIHGGMAVETDYIISVTTDEMVKATTQLVNNVDDSFESFKLSKTYNAFRTLSSQLKKIAEKSCTEASDPSEPPESPGSLPPDAARMVKFAESVSLLVNSQSTAYIEKLNYKSVKSLAKQRSQIIDDTLEVILKHYPTDLEAHPSMRQFASAIQTFFLTDHCEEEEEEEESQASSAASSTAKKAKKKTAFGSGKGIASVFQTPKKGSATEKKEVPTMTSPPVVPMSRKTRRSIVVRAAEHEQLQDAADLVVDEDHHGAPAKPERPKRPPAAPPGKSTGGGLADIPFLYPSIALAALAFLRSVQDKTVTLSTDYALLVAFGCFCLGLHAPRPSEVIAAPVAKKEVAFEKAGPAEPSAANRRLLRKSMASPTSASARAAWQVAAEEEEEEEEALIDSPMQKFPDGAELGTYFNCWSEPNVSDFKVRGPSYLSDKVKMSSGPFIFPVRGVDLFLTDACPEDVGSISGVMGGQLRDVPSFLVNFRLPWGVLVFYSEIPEELLPFLKAGYDPFFDSAKLPSMDDMTPPERTAARFLMNDDDKKNKTLKIVPIVVKGPWVVKSVVGGKPAIIGNKLPVSYVYSPRDGDKAEYLEADLDIAASSAARSIMSVCTSYTQTLTIDLGFVIQGNTEDELPEEMLMAARLHGIDPSTAPMLPPMKNMFMGSEPSLDDEESSQ